MRPYKLSNATQKMTGKTLYCTAICWADMPGLIPTKFGIYVATHDVIKISNLVIKLSWVSDLQGSHKPVFPLTSLFYSNKAMFTVRVRCSVAVAVSRVQPSPQDSRPRPRR